MQISKIALLTKMLLATVNLTQPTSCYSLPVTEILPAELVASTQIWTGMGGFDSSLIYPSSNYTSPSGGMDWISPGVQWITAATGPSDVTTTGNPTSRDYITLTGTDIIGDSSYSTKDGFTSHPITIGDGANFGANDLICIHGTVCDLNASGNVIPYGYHRVSFGSYDTIGVSQLTYWRAINNSGITSAQLLADQLAHQKEDPDIFSQGFIASQYDNIGAGFIENGYGLELGSYDKLWGYAPEDAGAPIEIMGSNNYGNPAVIGTHTNIGQGVIIDGESDPLEEVSNYDQVTQIGSYDNLGANVYIGPGSTIGDYVNIGQGVIVPPGTQIGANNYLPPGFLVTGNIPANTYPPKPGEYVAMQYFWEQTASGPQHITTDSLKVKIDPSYWEGKPPTGYPSVQDYNQDNLNPQALVRAINIHQSLFSHDIFSAQTWFNHEVINAQQDSLNLLQSTGLLSTNTNSLFIHVDDIFNVTTFGFTEQIFDKIFGLHRILEGIDIQDNLVNQLLVKTISPEIPDTISGVLYSELSWIFD